MKIFYACGTAHECDQAVTINKCTLLCEVFQMLYIKCLVMLIMLSSAVTDCINKHQAGRQLLIVQNGSNSIVKKRNHYKLGAIFPQDSLANFASMSVTGTVIYSSDKYFTFKISKLCKSRGNANKFLDAKHLANNIQVMI